VPRRATAETRMPSSVALKTSPSSPMRVACRPPYAGETDLARGLRPTVDVETASASDKRRTVRVRYWMDLMSAVVMAGATVATAWSAYQSSLWNGEHITHKGLATAAVVRVAKLTNLALQRTSVHVNLFVHWVTALNKGDSRTADFLLARFPEPLRTAAGVWLRTSPFNNPEAPTSPFDMPEYVVQETLAAARWEEIAQSESVAADSANRLANRYLLFTIVYASVLFFAGICGKFRWPTVDVAVLVLGALTLLVAVVIMLTSPQL
jgi:hypothetical protein